MPAALSGLALVLFLLVHLVGVSLTQLAPQRFEALAAALHQTFWLPMFELGLLAVALLHLALSLIKCLANRAAGNTAALSSRRRGPLAPLAAFAARSQAQAGLLLLLFLAVHLRQLQQQLGVRGDLPEADLRRLDQLDAAGAALRGRWTHRRPAACRRARTGLLLQRRGPAAHCSKPDG